MTTTSVETPSTSTSSEDRGISIIASFSLPGGRTECHAFDSSNTKEAVLGLPEGTEAVKPPPGSYAYSGVHDHGPMIPPREGGPLAAMVGFADAARKASDAYLTGIIEEEKAKAAEAKEKEAGEKKEKGEKRKADA